MGLLALAIGGGAVLGTAGAIYSANGAKTAASEANDANLKNTANTNAANLNLFNLSRGGINPATGYGNSILPQYLGGDETALGQSAYNNFLSLSNQIPGMSQNLSQYQSQLTPSLGNAAQAIAGRYNGQNLQAQLGYSQPLFQARLNQAGAQGSAINTGMLQALGQMNAQRAQQGFFGNSTFDRNRLGTSLVGARQGAANALAGARTQNANDTTGLQLNNLAGMQDISPLTNFMNNAGGYFNSPIISQSNAFNSALSPLNFFKLNPQTFQNQNLPYQNPQINGSQIAGGALGALGGAGMNYGMYQQMMQQMQQGQGVVGSQYYTGAANVGNDGLPFTG